MTQKSSFKDVMKTRAGRDLLTMASMVVMTPDQGPLNTAQGDLSAISATPDLAKAYEQDPQEAVVQLYTRRAISAKHGDDVHKALDLLGFGKTHQANNVVMTMKCIEMMHTRFAAPTVFPIPKDEKLMIITETGNMHYAMCLPDTDTLVNIADRKPVTMSYNVNGTVEVTFGDDAPITGIVRIVNLPAPTVEPTPTEAGMEI